MNKLTLIVCTTVLCIASASNAQKVGINTAFPTYELDVVGNIGHNAFMYHNDDADTYWRFTNNDQIQIRAGNLRMLDFIEGATDYVVFNQNSANIDFRIESNGQANQFYIDGGTDRIGIRTSAPANFFQMTNGGVNVGPNAMASYNNLGAEGVALSSYNQALTNPYNALEGITAYSGSVYIPSGVYGLAISTSLTHRAIGVRGVANGRDGVGVRGSRQNTGGIAGWGGVFYNDLGYTGFFGAASDEKAKKDIKTIHGALDIVDQLNPVTYHFDLEKYPNMGLNTEMEYGFIAQEVKAILPEIVREKGLSTNACEEVKPHEAQKNETESFVVMDYTRIIPILTKAVQEQQAIIKEQNDKVEKQNKQIELLLQITEELRAKISQ